MPEISIIIPTRNRGSLLASRALPSALAQEGVDQEVVVVDDGSSDDTVARLAAWDDARIRVVRVDGPHGVSIARNAGIAAARGEWLAFLDDDDVWAPTKLRTQLEVGRNENADFVYAGALAVDAQGTVIHELYLPPADELAAKLDQACVVPAGCSNVIARTEAVRRVHGFDERLANLADWDLWIRLVPIARPAACADVLVAYVLHDGNLHVVEDPGTSSTTSSGSTRTPTCRGESRSTVSAMRAGWRASAAEPGDTPRLPVCTCAPASHTARRAISSGPQTRCSASV